MFVSSLSTCLLVLINLRELDNSFSCELVSSFPAYESILIYLEQSFHSYMIPMDNWYRYLENRRKTGKSTIARQSWKPKRFKAKLSISLSSVEVSSPACFLPYVHHNKRDVGDQINNHQDSYTNSLITNLTILDIIEDVESCKNTTNTKDLSYTRG